MIDVTVCCRCKAHNRDEASTLCLATQDETGEYFCPGKKWPLEFLWDGRLTEEQARALRSDSGGPK